MPHSPSFRRVSGRPRSAFTLIELLTVIAIIGILAAILIPTVGAVRERAKTVQCTSRMRQWGTVVNLYAADNRGNYWISRSDYFEPWCVSLDATSGIKNAYSKYFNTPSGGLGDYILCPSKPDAQAEVGGNTPNYTGYVITWPTLGGAKVPDPTRVPMVRAKSPSRTILFTERHYSTTNGVTTAGATGPAASFSKDDAAKMQVYRAFERHNKTFNVVFFDGHVARMKWSSGDANTSLSTGVGALAPFNADWLNMDK